MRPDGAVVAETGRRFQAGGGFGSAPEGMPCRVNSEGDVMFVQGLLPPLSAQGQVPDLIGLDKEQALAELRALGLEPLVSYRSPEADNLVGTVVAQAPEPGSEADPGATVDIVVAAPISAPAPHITAEDRRLAEEMFDLARSPSADTAPAVPFTPTVQLGLADQLLERVDRSALSDPSAWKLRLYGFRAYVGPFSALDLLRDSRGSYDLSLRQHSACVGDVVQPPAPLSDLRQVSIEPGETDSCLDWWSVDLFVDRDGQVAGVTLDLYEP